LTVHRTRQRKFTVELPVLLGETTVDVSVPYGNGPWIYPIPQYIGSIYSPKTVSTWESWCTDETHPGPPYTSGGPLQIWRWGTDWYNPGEGVDVINRLWRYCGNHTTSVNPALFLGYSSLSDYALASGHDDVSSYGAEGWNKFRPTNSGAQIGVFLGEIHEVPRMLRTTAKGFADLWRSMGGSRTRFAPKKLANHWLNHQFGWLPFLADLRDFYRVSKSLDTKLKQLRRDNGRWIRRGGTIVVEADGPDLVQEQTTAPGLIPSVSSYLYNTPYGWSRTYRSITRRIWFKGAFRYWIPGKPDSWLWNAKAVSMLYGIQPSPSLVWELTPWSWLIDWASNAGDCINNLSSMLFDNLCAKYAYVMAHTRVECKTTGCSNYHTGAVTGSRSAFFESKTRIPASPFGFGLTGGDFSTRQWSILGALGLSRLKYT